MREFTIDRDWRFTSVSETAAVWCGASADDLIGRSSLDVWPPPQQAVADAVEAALAGSTAILEQPSLFAPGRWVRLEIGPRGGGVRFCIEDITPRLPAPWPAAMDGADSPYAGSLAHPRGGADAAIASIVSRLSSAYVLRGLQLLVDAFGDFRGGIVAQTIITANTAHLDARGGEGWRYASIDETPPNEARRPISIARIADASGLPFETTRRIVQRLADAGVCARTKGGLIVPAAAVEQPDLVRAVVANVGYVRRFLRDLQGVGLFEQPFVWSHAGDGPVGDRAIAGVVWRLSAEYALRAIRLLVDTYGDVRDGIIAQTIVAANTAHLDLRGGDGWRYAALDATPPDEVLRPISITGLARSLGLPFETTRRHVRRLIGAGVCHRVEGGLIVPRAVLDTPDAAASTLANTGYVRRLTRDLLAADLAARGRSGRPFGRPEHADPE